MAHTIFVYGTLKRGGSNHRLMAGQRYRGVAVTAPKYRIIDLGPHPGLIRDDASGLSVRGELWEVDDTALAVLDEFEGIPGDFVREAVAVAGGSEVVEAYFWTRGIPPGAPTGDRWPRG